MVSNSFTQLLSCSSKSWLNSYTKHVDTKICKFCLGNIKNVAIYKMDPKIRMLEYT